MSLTLKTRKVGEVTVIDLVGPLQIGEGVSGLRGAMRNLVVRHQNKLLLNLGEISYVGSAGLGELIGSFSSVTSRGGQLKLVNLTIRLSDLLQITKLVTVFEVYDDEERAIQSFSTTTHEPRSRKQEDPWDCSVTR